MHKQWHQIYHGGGGKAPPPGTQRVNSFCTVSTVLTVSLFYIDMIGKSEIGGPSFA